LQINDLVSTPPRRARGTSHAARMTVAPFGAASPIRQSARGFRLATSCERDELSVAHWWPLIWLSGPGRGKIADMGHRLKGARVWLFFQCTVGGVGAEPTAPDVGADAYVGEGVGRVAIDVGPVVGNDIDPGDASDSAGWNSVGPFGRQVLPPMRLKLRLAPMFNITPFAIATWVPGPNLTTGFATSEIGAEFALRPVQLGTRFTMNPVNGGVLLRNASYARWVETRYDFGIEAISHYALLGAPRVPPHLLLGSAGIQPSAEMLRVRFDTALYPEAARQYSSVRAFGRF